MTLNHVCSLEELVATYEATAQILEARDTIVASLPNYTPQDQDHLLAVAIQSPEAMVGLANQLKGNN